MGVSTRSKVNKTRSGNVRRSFDKSTPAKKKNHVKSRTKAARSPVAVVPPRPPSIRQRAGSMAADILAHIARVQPMGDPIDPALFGFYNFVPTLTRCVEGHLRRREGDPRARLWIYLVSEGLMKDDGRRVAQLPVIVVVESRVAPVDYTCGVSLQTNRRDFSSFDDAGLGWARNGDVFFLQSRNIFRGLGDVNALLPLKKPSMIDSLQPLPVEDVEVEYKGRAIMAQTRNDIIHAINLEEDLDLAADLDPLVESVRAEKQIRREREAGRVLAEKNFFSRMVTSLAAEHLTEESLVRASLEAMKIYKVYPEYEPETLPPPKEVFLWLGGTQRKGDVKNAKLDSLYGYVDGYY